MPARRPDRRHLGAAVRLALLTLLLGCGGAPPKHDGHHRQAHHHDFSDVERYAKWWDTPERDAWQKPDAVVAGLGLRPDSVVADLGAGTGYFALRIARAVPQGKVFAVDVEPKMLEHIARRAKEAGLTNVVTVLAEPGDPRLPEAVDVVFVCNTYHHIDAPTPYFEALVPRFARDERRLVIVDYRPDFDGPGPPKHMRIPVDQVATELGAAGYEEVARDTALLDRQYLLTLTPRR